MRYELLIKVLFKYGFENPRTIKFAKLIEKLPNNKLCNEYLKTLVKIWRV